MPINNKFASRLQHFRNQEDIQKSLFNKISNIRIFVFLTGAGITSFCFIKTSSLYGYSFLLVSLILFSYFVLKHQGIEKELKKTRCKININEQYLNRMDGSWIDFKENGQEFIDPSHPYTSDLDIFGAKSLFQWINVAQTFYGRQSLKNLFEDPKKDVGLIKRRQNAVIELAEQANFVEELQCVGMLAAEIKNDPSSLLIYAENDSALFQRKWLKTLFYIIPVATLLTMTLYFSEIPISIYVPLSLLILQMMITAIGFSQNSLSLNTVHKFKEDIDAFHTFIKLIENETFQNEYLTQLQSNLLSGTKSASLQIKYLERIVAASELRYNFISFCIMNFFLLWDFHCVFALEAWKKENGKLIRNWLQTIGEFEAIASLGVILQIHPQWSFPIFVGQGFHLPH